MTGSVDVSSDPIPTAPATPPPTATAMPTIEPYTISEAQAMEIVVMAQQNRDAERRLASLPPQSIPYIEIYNLWYRENWQWNDDTLSAIEDNVPSGYDQFDYIAAHFQALHGIFDNLSLDWRTTQVVDGKFTDKEPDIRSDEYGPYMESFCNHIIGRAAPLLTPPPTPSPTPPPGLEAYFISEEEFLELLSVAESIDIDAACSEWNVLDWDFDLLAKRITIRTGLTGDSTPTDKEIAHAWTYGVLSEYHGFDWNIDEEEYVPYLKGLCRHFRYIPEWHGKAPSFTEFYPPKFWEIEDSNG
jgi:hypothetical protein